MYHRLVPNANGGLVMQNHHIRCELLQRAFERLQCTQERVREEQQESGPWTSVETAWNGLEMGLWPMLMVVWW